MLVDKLITVKGAANSLKECYLLNSHFSWYDGNFIGHNYTTNLDFIIYYRTLHKSEVVNNKHLKDLISLQRRSVKTY